MIDTNKLRGVIAERGESQEEVAKAIGINKRTFYNKMRKGVFGSDEIEAMIEYLSIEDPTSIFFVQK